MPKCLQCGEVVGGFDIREGLCSQCYSPEAAKKIQKSEKALDKNLIELKKGEKIKRIIYKFDFFSLILGIFLPLIDGEFLLFLGIWAIWFIISFVMAKLHIPTQFIYAVGLGYMILIGWIYPKLRVKKYLLQGYEPSNEISWKRLKEAGLLKEK